jgi:hypothetical protein
MERLDGPTLEQARHAARRGLRGRRGQPLPALGAMVTFPQWVALNNRVPRDGAVYDLAFAAADFLIRRHGAAKVAGYFALFARSPDRAHNFRAAFDEDLADFERAFRADLADQR